MVVHTKNSIYTIDTTNRTISGGALGNMPVKYETLSAAMVGDILVADLVDGRQLRTSIITYVGNGLRYGQ